MNYDHGPVSVALTADMAKRLVLGSSGKERLLVALALGTGLSAYEIEKLRARDLNFPVLINGRSIHAARWVQRIVEPWGMNMDDQLVFKANAEYMQKVILKITNDILGEAHSIQALRRSFVRFCAEAEIPMQIPIENTGETAETIYNYYIQYAPRPVFSLDKILDLKLP